MIVYDRLKSYFSSFEIFIEIYRKELRIRIRLRILKKMTKLRKEVTSSVDRITKRLIW